MVKSAIRIRFHAHSIRFHPYFFGGALIHLVGETLKARVCATGSNSVCLLAAPTAEPLRACGRGKATFGVRGKGYSGAVRWGRAISSSCAGEVVVGCSERELGQLRAVRGGQRFGPVLGQPLLGGRPRCVRA